MRTEKEPLSGESEAPLKFNHDVQRGWSRNPNSHRLEYRGPIHRVTFPPPFLAYEEIMQWTLLGYTAIGEGLDIMNDRTITVYNYIDPSFMAALKAGGVQFETTEGEYTQK